MTLKQHPKHAGHTSRQWKPSIRSRSLSSRSSTTQSLSAAQYNNNDSKIIYSEYSSEDSGEDSGEDSRKDRARHLGSNKQPISTARPRRLRRHKRRRNFGSVSAWETKPGPIVLSGSDTELEDLKGDCISAADPQPEDHGLSHTGLLDAELHEPMTADCFHPQGQEVAKTPESPPLEEFTTPAKIDLGDSHSHGTSPEGLAHTYLPDDKDVRQIHLAKLSQYPVKEEKEIAASPTSALMLDPECLSRAAKVYWGRGYALVPEGCELDRTANNARRREEISSNISSQYVITGKRSRTSGRNRA
jgi:hypothetical protein